MSKKTLTILIVVGLVFVGVMIWAGQTEAPAPEVDETATTTDEDVESSEMPVPGTDTDEMVVGEDTTEDSSQNEPADDSDSMVDDDSVVSVHMVSYTSSGFSPATVEIQAGDTVVWQSEDGTDMWVASAMHPTHSVYAGTNLNEHCNGDSSNAFDQCERGERYEFTFEKSGEWGYHNHVRSGHTGQVIVE